MLTTTTYSQQNLIPNGSFEVYSTCPDNQGEVYLAYPWFDPTNESSDYFNSCCNNGIAGVPNNFYGYKYSFEGNGYAAFATYEGNGIGANYREYIAIKLNESLLPTHEYCFTAYVSPSNNFKYYSNNIGILLSKDTVGLSRFYGNYIAIKPTANNDTIIADTNKWTQIDLKFKATGNEIFLIIGNFFNDVNTKYIISNPNGYEGAYYYIDKVSLTDCSELNIPNIFTPNNDNVNDFFAINFLPENSKLTIYNRWGDKIYYSSNYKNDWDGKNITDGVYYYLLETNEKVYKGYIQLIN